MLALTVSTKSFHIQEIMCRQAFKDLIEHLRHSKLFMIFDNYDTAIQRLKCLPLLITVCGMQNCFWDEGPAGFKLVLVVGYIIWFIQIFPPQVFFFSLLLFLPFPSLVEGQNERKDQIWREEKNPMWQMMRFEAETKDFLLHPLQTFQ